MLRLEVEPKFHLLQYIPLDTRGKCRFFADRADDTFRSGSIDPMGHLLLRFKVWNDQRGQDLIEYALMAGFVAVATGATFPPAANMISQIFSKVGSVMSAANNAS
jgi:Flp pilus assembly pilin Flp